jgi:hypothetical protein
LRLILSEVEGRTTSLPSTVAHAILAAKLTTLG